MNGQIANICIALGSLFFMVGSLINFVRAW